MQAQKRSKRMSSGWQPIVTAPKNDERILVSGGTWIRGNKQTLPQSFPCLVIWDETEWLICDNEGPRALIRGPKFWMAIPPTVSCFFGRQYWQVYFRLFFSTSRGRP